MYDAGAAGSVVAASMMVEPGYVAVMPDEEIRRQVLLYLVTDSAREAIAHDAAFGAFDGDRLIGASLWLPPGTYPPPPMPPGVQPPLPPYLRELDEDVLQGLIAYDENCVRHFPDEPAWYLMYLGVDPEAQGNGTGSAILRESLRSVMERQAAPAYLETGTERNVRFYERFGFGVREAGVQLVPGETRHWTMTRPVPVQL
jgi:ribosomal protein S18 acetylase RimI-like enzyme